MNYERVVIVIRIFHKTIKRDYAGYHTAVKTCLETEHLTGLYNLPGFYLF